MITLITGGQRSGKSNFAESILRDKKDVTYIATSLADGEEMKERIRIHRSHRPKTWRTVETYRNFSEYIDENDYYILECVGTMVSNIMYEKTKDLEMIDTKLSKEIEDDIFNEISDLIVSAKEKDKNLIIVTNEVGLSLTPNNHVGRVYTDILGRVNQRIGKMVDKAYLIVSGIELELK